MPKALAGTTGTCRLCRRAETRLPNDAVSVAATPSAIPKILWEPEFIVAQIVPECQNDPEQTKGCAGDHLAIRFQSEKEPVVENVKDNEQRKDDGYAAGHEVLLGLIEQHVVCRE